MSKPTLFLSTLLLSLFTGSAFSQTEKMETDSTEESYPQALVSFDDYKMLVSKVESHRASRLISLDTFLKMSNDPNTIILDTRSKYRYDRKHIKGAKHLAFTEFTRRNLIRLIRNSKKRILIYCNNNFIGDQVDFASKSGPSQRDSDREFVPNRTAIMLALNIPTFLNLYGYGYKNVYELHELVNVNDPRIEFEGTHANTRYISGITLKDIPKPSKKTKKK